MRPSEAPSLKTVFLGLLMLVSLTACVSKPTFQDPFSRPQIDWKPNLILSEAQAESVLGEKATLEKVTSYVDNGVLTYQSSYQADVIDAASGKRGALGYMYEEYPDSEAARTDLYSTLEENHLNPEDGVQTPDGAELHFMAGGPIVRMVMILRGNHLLRLKVNPPTSHYEFTQLRLVAEEMASTL